MTELVRAQDHGTATDSTAKAAGDQSMLDPSVDGTGDVQRRRKQGAPEARAVERRRIAEMRRFAGARRATLGPGSAS